MSQAELRKFKNALQMAALKSVVVTTIIGGLLAIIDPTKLTVWAVLGANTMIAAHFQWYVTEVDKRLND
ncbi:MAG: hypothetical protein RLN70_03565 [Rhodospirillaceae bacterium]